MSTYSPDVFLNNTIILNDHVCQMTHFFHPAFLNIFPWVLPLAEFLLVLVVDYFSYNPQVRTM